MICLCDKGHTKLHCGAFKARALPFYLAISCRAVNESKTTYDEKKAHLGVSGDLLARLPKNLGHPETSGPAKSGVS